MQLVGQAACAHLSCDFVAEYSSFVSFSFAWLWYVAAAAVLAGLAMVYRHLWLTRPAGTAVLRPRRAVKANKKKKTEKNRKQKEKKQQKGK